MNDADALLRAMAEIFSDDGDAADDFAKDAEPEPEPYAGWARSDEPAQEALFQEQAPLPPPEPKPAVDVESEPPPETYIDSEPPLDAEEAFEEAESQPPPGVEAAAEAEVAVSEPEPPTELAEETAGPKGSTLDPDAPRDWQRWVRELEGTRGPKPLAVVERTFVSAFVPLSDAFARGIAGEEAAPILDVWSKSFAKSYSEAFDALKMRGKRPTMVLDVPDIALRMGRLHGARSVQLVLVDGMRFDLGLRVNERLKILLGQHAALTERLLLWSALPSTTSVQLELIGRGPQGLREIGEGAESEVPVARGRAAATLRRVRAGHREVHKLDLVESALSVPGAPLAERFDCLADETAEALANHILKLQPRTLVLVFGDHGFTLEPIGPGTSAGHSGGASPEEVLVPAFAWLVGRVH